MKATIRSLVLLLVLAVPSRAEPDEKILVPPDGRTRANAWTEISLPAAINPTEPTSAPVLVDITDPWGQTVFTGVTRGNTCSFFTRAWADGVY